jgi:hypothetical protein
MVVKLPVTTLLAFAGGAVATVVLWRRSGSRTALLCVGLPALALTITTFQVPRTVGLRYLLPVLVLLGVLAGALPRALPRRAAGAALAVVAVVQLASLWESSPHSLAWTAPPFRPGYRMVTDSNLDWGQDLYRLESWLKGRSAAVDYLGAMPLRRERGTTSLSETPVEDVRGLVAVSASWVTSYRREKYGWLRKYCTVGDLGGTILLYDFRAPPDPSPGPPIPAGRCRGRFSEWR